MCKWFGHACQRFRITAILLYDLCYAYPLYNQHFCCPFGKRFHNGSMQILLRGIIDSLLLGRLNIFIFITKYYHSLRHFGSIRNLII